MYQHKFDEAMAIFDQLRCCHFLTTLFLLIFFAPFAAMICRTTYRSARTRLNRFRFSCDCFSHSNRHLPFFAIFFFLFLLCSLWCSIAHLEEIRNDVSVCAATGDLSALTFCCGAAHSTPPPRAPTRNQWSWIRKTPLRTFCCCQRCCGCCSPPLLQAAKVWLVSAPTSDRVARRHHLGTLLTSTNNCRPVVVLTTATVEKKSVFFLCFFLFFLLSFSLFGTVDH